METVLITIDALSSLVQNLHSSPYRSLLAIELLYIYFFSFIVFYSL